MRQLRGGAPSHAPLHLRGPTRHHRRSHGVRLALVHILRGPHFEPAAVRLALHRARVLLLTGRTRALHLGVLLLLLTRRAHALHAYGAPSAWIDGTLPPPITASATASASRSPASPGVLSAGLRWRGGVAK